MKFVDKFLSLLFIFKVKIRTCVDTIFVYRNLTVTLFSDVISLSDVMVHTPGPVPFNVFSNVTISFVLSCVTFPLCDLASHFTYDDISCK